MGFCYSVMTVIEQKIKVVSTLTNHVVSERCSLTITKQTNKQTNQKTAKQERDT